MSTDLLAVAREKGECGPMPIQRTGSKQKIGMRRASAQISGKMVSARVLAMQKTQKVMETISLQNTKPAEKMTKRKLSTLMKGDAQMEHELDQIMRDVLTLESEKDNRPWYSVRNSSVRKVCGHAPRQASSRPRASPQRMLVALARAPRRPHPPPHAQKP